MDAQWNIGSFHVIRVALSWIRVLLLHPGPTDNETERTTKFLKELRRDCFRSCCTIHQALFFLSRVLDSC